MDFFRLIKHHKNKVAMTSVILMAVILFSVFSVGFSEKSSEEKNLKIVHVIMRHGARTPASTYPNDPYKNFTFFPNGWGQLTNPGKLELYKIGEYLRDRYGKFLGDLYFPENYLSQSTDVDRTKMTAQLVNAGLWKPGKAQKFAEINWQPIPVHYEKLNEDMLLLVRKPCAQYSLEQIRVKNSTEIQKKLKEFSEVFRKVANFTGAKMEYFEDAEDVYSTLLAEKNFNLTLPQWAQEYLPKLETPTIWFYVVNSYNEKMKRLKGGVLLKKLLNDWEKFDRKKFFLYVGHDSTVSNLLSTLNVFDPQIPGYAISIFLEYSEKNGVNGVEIFLRNSTDVPPFQLKIPGCDSFCPLTKLKNLTKNVIPENWEKECESDVPNFTPPPPGGP